MNALLVCFALAVSGCAGQLLQPFPDASTNATNSNSTAPSSGQDGSSSQPPSYGGWPLAWHPQVSGLWGPPSPPSNNFLPGFNQGFPSGFSQPASFNWYPGFATGFNQGFIPRPFPGFPNFGAGFGR